jgi:hypothetical protein
MTNMKTTETPIIDSSGAHNVTVDVQRALEILELDPVQSAKLLQRALNNLHFHIQISRRTQIVNSPDYLFVDPDHPIFSPLP